MNGLTHSRTFTLSLLVMALPALGCNIVDIGGPELQDPEQGDVKILFIGSSYFTVNDLPGIFEAFANEAGRQVFVRREMTPGYYLDHFAGSSSAARAIREQEWDFVVLQGGCQNAAYPEDHHLITPSSGYHPVLPALDHLRQKVGHNHGGTRVVYMIPWAFEDGMTWVQGQTDTYEDMQLKIRDNVLRWADSLDLVVAPVGMAWYDVLREGRSQHYLHTSDWNHPNMRGSYLSAATIFVTLFLESLEGVEYDGPISPSAAETLRRSASRTVLDSLSLWNLPTGGGDP
jgi:hypothetical protein